MGFKVNELQFDEWGRVNGVLAINKPKGLTSHDVVARVRRILHTKKVGHAGALDPFATGVLVVLVGKATKLSDKFIDSDKEYVADVLFGVSTDTADTEGKVLALAEIEELNEEELEATLQKFIPEYEQTVPVFSSVKVDGQKLRVLARQADSHEVVWRDGARVAVFHKGDKNTEVELPKVTRQIPEMEILELTKKELRETEFYESISDWKSEHADSNSAIHPDSIENFPLARIRISCSKGTYVRALAEDIGNTLPQPAPAMLLELQRTRVDRIPLKHALTLEEVEEKYGVNEEEEPADQIPSESPLT